MRTDARSTLAPRGRSTTAGRQSNGEHRRHGGRRRRRRRRRDGLERVVRRQDRCTSASKSQHPRATKHFSSTTGRERRRRKRRGAPQRSSPAEASAPTRPSRKTARDRARRHSSSSSAVWPSGWPRSASCCFDEAPLDATSPPTSKSRLSPPRAPPGASASPSSRPIVACAAWCAPRAATISPQAARSARTTATDWSRLRSLPWNPGTSAGGVCPTCGRGYDPGVKTCPGPRRRPGSGCGLPAPRSSSRSPRNGGKSARAAAAATAARPHFAGKTARAGAGELISGTADSAAPFAGLDRIGPSRSALQRLGH